MNSPVTAFRLRPGIPLLVPTEARERSVQRRVGLAYSLLVLNALTFYPGISFLPIPSIVGKGVAQAALPAALFVALSVNRRGLLRPNVFLCLVCLLVIEALITSLQPQHLGTVIRTFRLAGFVTVLWLLTPWWGRRDMLLVRSYRVAMLVILGTVLLGLAVAPSHALAGGRLGGAIWPIPATQVAHYAAITIGLTAVLWACGHLRGRAALLVVAVAGIMLVMTHTRTALVAMLTGLLVAGLSLFAAKARVRKLFAVTGVVVSIAAITLSGVLTTWLARGESSQELANFTGRTTVWGAIATIPRNKFQVLLGFGLSNKSFEGLPIDSNWLASYYDQGLIGVTICATMLLFLLVTAYFRPRGVERALALFLVTYCMLASFTEVGFTDASTYLLELTLAASLLVPTADSRPP